MPAFESFRADAQGAQDYTVDVIARKPDNGDSCLMVILATEEAVYITMAQAMAFFNLIPNPT